MARRGWRTKNYREGKMMLAQHLDAAQQKVIRLFKNEVAMCIRPDFKAKDVLDWCIDPVHQKVLYGARGIVDDTGHAREKTVIKDRVDVRIRFSSVHMATPEPHIIHDFAVDTPIFKLAGTLSDLRMKWARVAALVKWFDKVGTPGAARNLWPTLSVLAPEHEGLQEANVGTYYVDPPGYSLWLPAIRETATTVAAALMLPTPEDESAKCVEFILPSVVHNFNGEQVSFGGITLPLC